MLGCFQVMGSIFFNVLVEGVYHSNVFVGALFLNGGFDFFVAEELVVSRRCSMGEHVIVAPDVFPEQAVDESFLFRRKFLAFEFHVMGNEIVWVYKMSLYIVTAENFKSS